MLVNIRFSITIFGNYPCSLKKAKGLTTTLHSPHPFLYISLPSLHDYEKKLPDFTICGGRKHKIMTWTRWNKGDKGEAARIQFLSDIS